MLNEERAEHEDLTVGEEAEAETAEFGEVAGPGGAELFGFPPFGFDEQHRGLGEFVLVGEALDDVALAARQLMD